MSGLFSKKNSKLIVIIVKHLWIRVGGESAPFLSIDTIKTQLKYIYIQSGSLIMNPYRTKNFVHNIETSY